jgi:hypothetical protein
MLLQCCRQCHAAGWQLCQHSRLLPLLPLVLHAAAAAAWVAVVMALVLAVCHLYSLALALAGLLRC